MAADQDDDLRNALASTITAHGLEHTKKLISKIFSEYSARNAPTVLCLYCNAQARVLDELTESVSIIECGTCSMEFLVYSGRVRTSRRRRPVPSWDYLITVRSYDKDNKERAIEFYSSNIDIEFKSNDIISISVKRIRNYPGPEFEVRVHNDTVRKTFYGTADNSILDSLLDGTELREDSLLRQIPPEMDADYLRRLEDKRREEEDERREEEERMELLLKTSTWFLAARAIAVEYSDGTLNVEEACDALVELCDEMAIREERVWETETDDCIDDDDMDLVLNFRKYQDLEILEPEDIDRVKTVLSKLKSVYPEAKSQH